MSNITNFPLLFSIIKEDHKVAGYGEAQKEDGPNLFPVKQKSICLNKQVDILRATFNFIILILDLKLFLLWEVTQRRILNDNSNNAKDECCNYDREYNPEASFSVQSNIFQTILW